MGNSENKFDVHCLGQPSDKEGRKELMRKVELAEKGTIMAEFQKERTDAISEIFDNVDEHGIYPTTKFFIRLDNAVEKALLRQRNEILNRRGCQMTTRDVTLTLLTRMEHGSDNCGSNVPVQITDRKIGCKLLLTPAQSADLMWAIDYEQKVFVLLTLDE